MRKAEHKTTHKKKKNRNNNNNNNNNNNKNNSNNNRGHKNEENEEDENKVTTNNNSILTGTELFSIKTSSVMGRYVVAKNAINAGTIIIEENPLVVGPCTDHPYVCLGCYHNFDKDPCLKQYKCECGWPLCNSNCPGLGRPFGHTKTECLALQKTQKKGAGEWYSAITPLRCLLLMKHQPELFKKLLKLESLNDVRKGRPKIWDFNQTYVVDRIRNAWQMADEFPDELIHTICGILEVNAFEVGQNGVSVRAVYPTAFLLAHDCVPNTTHTDDDFRLIIRMAQTVAAQGMITLSYAYTLQSTQLRRQHLWESKFFWCCCKRCTDPTELGTHAGTLLCPRCHCGHVLSTEPLNLAAPWKCTSSSEVCPEGYTVAAATVQLLNDKISDEVESIDGNNVKLFEEFLFRYRNVLHPNHFHFLGVKHSLSQIYGKISDYMIQNLSEKLLERKIEICRQILTVFDQLEPGLSRLRGITLYELHAPLMIVITRDYQNKNITKPQLKRRLKEVVSCLKDSEKILSLEPSYSVEGVMASAAQEALCRVKDWEKILGKI